MIQEVKKVKRNPDLDYGIGFSYPANIPINILVPPGGRLAGRADSDCLMASILQNDLSMSIHLLSTRWDTQWQTKTELIWLYICTHNAGAELLVCDVQGVSVSVEPPACPIFTCPLPVFEMRHLPSLRWTTLFSPFNAHSIASSPIFCSKCFVVTRVLCVA